MTLRHPVAGFAVPPPGRGAGLHTAAVTSSGPRIGPGWYALGRVVERLLHLVLLLQLASVLLAIWGIATFGGSTATTGIVEAARDYDTLKRASGVAGMALDGLAGLVLAAWLYRAHRSDRVSPDWTEHWAVWTFAGWVPPFCFFMPYGVIRDLRRGAEGTRDFRWPALGWWLTTLWMGVFVSWLAAAMYAQAAGDDVPVRLHADSYASGAWMDLISGVLLCCALLLLLRVVRTVRRVVTDSPFGARVAESAPMR